MSEIRNDCLNLIMAVLEDKKPSHLVIADYLNSHNDLPRADKNFVKKTVQGVVERAITLDCVIDSVASTPVRKQKPVIRNILRMGAYQILYMDVPDRAACNEAVLLTKKRKFMQLSGFVNAVMRNVSRQKDGFGHFESLAAQYSMPQWIVDYFVKNYGREACEKAFLYFLSDNLTSIRVNTALISVAELISKLKALGVQVMETEVPGALKIGGYGSLSDIPEFMSGMFTVQDGSSVLAGEQAQIRAGYRILDLCAAPGGKSLHAANRLKLCEGTGAGMESSNAQEMGNVISCDISSQKVALIDENIKRCGFKNIKTMVNDATVLRDEFVGAFDVVICDVPCSGLGIIGKKPDIKYNMTPEGQKELTVLQRSILDNAVRYVKSGGQMIFSTCTVNRAENEDNVKYIEAKGFKAETMRQLLPGEIGTDGFFYARLIRTAEE